MDFYNQINENLIDCFRINRKFVDKIYDGKRDRNDFPKKPTRMA